MSTDRRPALEEEIIRATSRKIERLPVLEAIFERQAQGLSVALKNFCGMPAEARVENVTYVSCGEALEGTDQTWLSVVCDADPWDGRLAIALDPQLLFSLLEILLGGRAANASDWTPRSFTSIEKRLARQLCELTLQELGTAFAPVSKVDFSVGWIESSPQAIMIAPQKAQCTRITLEVDIDGRGGRIVFVIPFRTLDPVKARLSEMFLGEQFGEDETWSNRMKETLTDTEVTVTALLRTMRVPLAKALDWQVGQVIDLGIAPDSEVTVSVRGRDLMRGAMGRRRTGAAAIRITDTNFTTAGGEK
ncbi:hypothetical protein OCH239_00190 [Roseivivax halodurans JCM 10272]|uniref:Flagellar motor switch protein FliM n=1 Tax=Roseivivax halodurans JCM 10272 TaxID=1449350 RepID=X7EL85_9RHOB|nr:FliM/FliN family flagellar motor switch protein [Roseivivax halodurans]ETX16697.1 hypothetical protein OCH239_00190 [Roseivivax halodurans JCM 10272]